MRNTIFLASLALAVSGCSSMTEGTPRADGACKPTHDVSVMVIGSNIDLDPPDPIYVCDKNVKITWTLHKNSQAIYEFRDDSIQIEDKDDEFENCRKGKQGKEGRGELEGMDKIKCGDKNNKKGSGAPRYYKYDIKVYLQGPTNDGPRWDPTVVNY